MYLEPIFSSEDIMRQMPTEARNFRDVDKEWRAIMAATQKEPMVLQATDFPGRCHAMSTAYSTFWRINGAPSRVLYFLTMLVL